MLKEVIAQYWNVWYYLWERWHRVHYII